MSKNQKIISVDQFYTERLNEAPLDISAEANWDLFEAAQSKPKSGWNLGSKIFIVSLIVILGLSVALFIKSGTSELQGKSFSKVENSEISKTETQNILNNIDLSHTTVSNAVSKSADVIENIEATNITSSLAGEHRTTTSDSEKVSNGKTSFTSKTIVSDDNGKYTTNTKSLKASGKKLQMLTDFSNKNTIILNDKPSSINYENTIDQTAQGAATLQGGSPQSSSGLAEKSIVDKRSQLSFVSLVAFQAQLISSPQLTVSPNIVQPVSTGKQSRWAIDLGFSLNKEYELSDAFSLETVSNRLRASHLSLGYSHLTKRYFTTRAYISYDKIYGTEEFVGQRIVRTYADDNLSLGYGINLKLTKRLGLESSLSLGMSFIDKIELEQKPIWVDGKREYKDYTKSTFTMNPTPTYQTHTKVTYQLPYGLDIFAGGTYRSQFATKLSSTQTTRENTLDKFADLQFIVGLRYHIK